jgi:microcin C transport system substrate-binding protein
MSNFSRRRILTLAAGATVSPGLLRGGVAAAVEARSSQSAAGEGTEVHGISSFGDLKYPADFRHFDYVEPNAPKGGIFSQIGPVRMFNQNFLTFNSLNSFILKGDAAQGMELTFATLMTAAEDEPDALYGLAADKVRISPDGLVYRFHMRPQARFHDGTRLTARDVAFSVNLLKDKGHPYITQSMRDVVGIEAQDDENVTVRFAPGRARDVPLFVASLPIFSRAYYTAHNFDESNLEIPLGSGPYRVGRFEAGRFIEYERVRDWWGAALPANVGQYNFDIVRYEFYRDRDVGFQGFTAKNYLFREEFTSRTWATAYTFPALRDGRVKREEFPDDTPSGGQGWMFNLRRPKFANPRLREAIGYAFDFEWTNKNIMYGSFKRCHSVFQNTDMMATGLPSPQELKLLDPWHGRIPDLAFGEAVVPPVSDGSGQDRAMLRKATQILNEAGFVIKGGKRVSPSGEPVTIEFLIDEPTIEPHHGPFIKNLATLGIDATMRLVDAVQYKAREDDRDFDVTMQRMNFSTVPGDSLRPYFSSQAAAAPGSYNLAGIANPAIDDLIEKIIDASTRPELVVACRALDRILRAGFYWVPQWSMGFHWIAYWDVFGFPKAHPRYQRGIPETWWYDRDKAAKLERAG